MDGEKSSSQLPQKTINSGGRIVNWACGLMTVPERLKTHLPRTKDSITKGGFKIDLVFVDGPTDRTPYHELFPESVITIRDPRIHTFGNWMLGMLELIIRWPHAQRYAIFQDDLIMCSNVREYLEQTDYPFQGYLNLYTMPENLLFSGGKAGWCKANQKGRGALALVFNREAIDALCKRFDYVMRHPRDAKRGKTNEDGIIVIAMNQAGWSEYIHNPSLVQHTGTKTMAGSRTWPDSESFPGESFNALELLK